MATNKLYGSWTWKPKLPTPFNDPSIKLNSTTHISNYNNATTKLSVLHSAALHGILAYMELEESTANGLPCNGAIGTQGHDMIVAEYPSNIGEIQAVAFNRTTGRFNAGKFSAPGDSPSPYILKEDKDSGAALFFALMPIALEEDEFQTEYENLLDQKRHGFPNLKEMTRCGYILCDNLYRRIENARNLGRAGINTNIPMTSNIQGFTAINLQKSTYVPTSVLYGDFQILVPGATSAGPFVTIPHTDFVGKYAFDNTAFSPQEKAMIPEMPEWYVIPQEVVRVCKHIKQTTESMQPMRNFMLRGPSGTGKTEAAKAIAAGLEIPYTFITCSANTETFDFLGQILPDVKGMNTSSSSRSISNVVPSFEDISMDPASAYFTLTGTYNNSITEAEVYDKLVEVLEAKIKSANDAIGDGEKQKFRYVDTPLVQAIRYGYLCEIQEPTVIANPGVLVGLNALLDRCNAITLPTGERVQRHPNTVIIITTNNDYAGCKNVNQSIISRMNLVMDIEQPDIETMVERVCGATGCKDLIAVRRMAEVIDDIAQRCRETMITDGCCGMREFIAWVQSFMICGNELEAAQYTVLSSVSGDPENRADILNTCLTTKYGAK